jgi:hypothetical protein
MDWEYRTFTRGCRRDAEGGSPAIEAKRIESELNALGLDGWELVAVVPVPEDGVLSAATYFLKRSKDGNGGEVFVGAER